MGLRIIFFLLLFLPWVICAEGDQDKKESLTTTAVTAGTLALLTTKAGAVKALVIGSRVVPYAAVGGIVVVLYLLKQKRDWHAENTLRRNITSTNERVNKIAADVIQLTREVEQTREDVIKIGNVTNSLRRETTKRFDIVDKNIREVQNTQLVLKETCATRQQVNKCWDGVTRLEGSTAVLSKKLEKQFQETKQIREQVNTIEKNCKDILIKLNNLQKQTQNDSHIKDLISKVNESKNGIEEFKEKLNFQEKLLKDEMGQLQQSQKVLHEKIDCLLTFAHDALPPADAQRDRLQKLINPGFKRQSLMSYHRVEAVEN